MRTDDILQIPADTLLAEELADEDVVEMANLTTAQTGVPRSILISTAMGGHGPRVKYFLEPGRSQPSFSLIVSDAPTVAANSLPGFAQQRCFVGRTQPEVNDFIQKLQRSAHALSSPLRRRGPIGRVLNLGALDSRLRGNDEVG
jgi:hypothetical protein